MNFIIDGKSVIFEMELNSIITEKIITYEGSFAILLYYDELYKQHYSDDKILQDTSYICKLLLVVLFPLMLYC